VWVPVDAAAATVAANGTTNRDDVFSACHLRFAHWRSEAAGAAAIPYVLQVRQGVLSPDIDLFD